MYTQNKISQRLTRCLSAFCAMWLASWATLGIIKIEYVSAASSWNPTLIVNTEAFQSIDDTDTTANVVLRFGDTINKSLTYDRSLARFQFDDDLYISGGLDVTGTVSGATLYGTRSLRSSGSLVFEGAASGSSLYLGTSLQGAGLTDCDADGQTVAWDASTGRFSCGDDDTGGASTPEVGTSSFTGGVIRTSDSRYVNTAGDTMTGSLLIEKTITAAASGALTINQRTIQTGAFIGSTTTAAPALAIDIAGTSTSPHIVFGYQGTFDANLYRSAAATLRTNASLLVDGSLTFGDAINDAITVNAAAWTFANATNFAVTNAANAFSIDTDTLSVDALNNRIGIRTTAPDNPLEVVGTISGSVVYGNNGLRSSGSLVWEGVGSGASLYLGGSLQGVGLTDCDTAGTSKLLWDSTTGRFSCGTDQAGGTGSPEIGTASFSGGVVRVSDGRYVNTSGDTMTGVLTVQNGNTHTPTSTPLINARGTMSGVTVYANSQLRSSGSLTVEGTTAFQGIQYTWPGSAASASGKVLKVNPANGQLSWSDDSTGGGGGPSTVVSTANVSDSTTGGTNNVTGLTIPVSASTNYIIRCLLTTNAATTTTGVQITVNGPASPTQVTWNRQSCSSTTALVNANINAFGTEDARTGSAGATRCIEPIRIHLRNGANAGNVTFSVDTEIASSAVTVYTGSFCDYQSY